eukprot:gene3832-4422_t
MSSSSHKIVKCIMLGESGVGKTSLISQYTQKKFSTQHKATIGVDFQTRDLDIDGVKVTLQIWDTAGQERFHSIGVAFYRGADCCILVYDVNDLSSFNQLGKWRDEFLLQSGAPTVVGDNPTPGDNYQFVVIGNKIDTESQRVVSQKRALQWCEENGNICYYEMSASRADNVEKSFYSIAKNV